MCCLPNIDAPNLGYDNLFRIIIMQFIDAYNFDVRAIKKSCVHIVNKDNKIIPFETMNLFYRDDKLARLEELRKADLQGWLKDTILEHILSRANGRLT